MMNNKYKVEIGKEKVNKKALAEKLERAAHDLRAGRDPFQEMCKEATHKAAKKCVMSLHESCLGDNQVELAILPNVIASMAMSCFVSASQDLEKKDYIEGINMCFKEAAGLIHQHIDEMLKDVRKGIKEAK